MPDADEHEASGPSPNGLRRSLPGLLLPVFSTLMATAIVGLFLMWQKVLVLEERHAVMSRVDQEQSLRLTSCSDAMIEAYYNYFTRQGYCAAPKQMP